MYYLFQDNLGLKNDNIQESWKHSYTQQSNTITKIYINNMTI